ncbi:MAG: adenylate/guanylate cyclase domain-containing protein [Deltaproteobacteria bacterium]|nr:adenylate/guanylate cyclase domain-containing protein [Deltaproteobacteria bacterium]
MISRRVGSLILGLFIGAAGVGIGLAPFGLALEEDLGLELLFRLRGPRKPPPEVVIVSIDKASSDRMDLPHDLRKWPRSLHARLTDVLSENGAAVIAFDVFFEDPRIPSDDERLAESFRNARNVVLCERLQTERLSMGDLKETPRADVGMSKLVSPLPSFAESAAAKAPFPLPKVPAKVTRTWTFRTGAGDTPTLPVVAFRLYASPAAYDEFARMHGGEDFAYLNFYGGARTIPTIPYFQALRLADKGAPAEREIDVRGKAIFVGSSELLQQEQIDGFHTVFTKTGGLELSGVEIAATAFANFLENDFLRPPHAGALAALLFLWGLGIGVLCRSLPPLHAAGSALGLSVLYVMAVSFQFASSSWYPVIVPVFLQAPMGLVAALTWQYLDVNKERRNIRFAFEHYLPNEVVDRLARDLSYLKASDQLVYGTCLVTDAENYTSLSESMGPQELGGFMNRYYETLFAPVKKHQGTVSNVVADSMLALWASASGESSQRKLACLAALDIAVAVGRADSERDPARYPTRIALHSGRILLGNLGAMDHYEYRPVGDIVNTATRIEGLNKQLGTRILATDEVVRGLDGFLTREVGTFLLAGKSNPTVVHEILCMRDDADERLVWLSGKFAEGLERFRDRSFADAIAIFSKALERMGGDGPSIFYLNLCRQYCDNPPQEETWGGVIRIFQK